jgi:hypothetical protein
MNSSSKASYIGTDKGEPSRMAQAKTSANPKASLPSRLRQGKSSGMFASR